jgi:hypothetical protein
MDKKIYNYVDQALPERKELLGKDSCTIDEKMYIMEDDLIFYVA